MAEVHASAEVDIDCDAQTLWDLIVDLEDYPSWSKIHKDVTVETWNDEGYPERVRMKMSVAGISDVQVVDHVWYEDSVEWTLVSSSVQRAQTGRYTVTETADGCMAKLEGMVDLKIPIPSLVIRQGQKLVLGIATKGVKAEAEKRQRTAG